MKRKIYKIVLILSFIPIVALVLISLYYAIFGYDVYTMVLPTYRGTIYGMEAFANSFIWNVLSLTFIPVLPVCLIYQIVYFLVHITRKNKNKHYLKVMFGDESQFEGHFYKYKIGEVNIAEYWNVNDLENPGGFNFSTEDKIARWLVRGDTLYDVTLPADSEVIEIKRDASPNGVFRTNKIILTNPRKVTDEIALELYKKSKLPEKSYFETIAGYALRGYINSAKQIIKDKVNKNNIDIAIKEYENFYKGHTQEEKDNYNEILNELRKIQNV